MTGKEFQEVLNTIENEGFAYAFFGYSDFDEIKDKEFHKLRLAFVEAGHKLAEYVGYDECIG